MAQFDVVAIDCEMVGVAGSSNNPNEQSTIDDALCRVSVVAGSEESDFKVLMDLWVKVEREVVDFRTAVTGVDAETYAQKTKVDYNTARGAVKALINGRIVVGHAIWNDFRVLNLAHPCELVRDTSLHKDLRPPWRQRLLPSLKLLSEHWLSQKIHEGAHDSVEDATIALRLYQLAPFDSCSPLDSDIVSSKYGDAKDCSSAGLDIGKRSRSLAIGDPVLACFHGEWHPAHIRRIDEEDGKIEVLWELEWSVSLLPATNVLPIDVSDDVPEDDITHVSDDVSDDVTTDTSITSDPPEPSDVSSISLPEHAESTGIPEPSDLSSLSLREARMDEVKSPPKKSRWIPAPPLIPPPPPPLDEFPHKAAVSKRNRADVKERVLPPPPPPPPQEDELDELTRQLIIEMTAEPSWADVVQNRKSHW